MTKLLLVLLTLVGITQGFTIPQKSFSKLALEAKKGWFDFTPFHGHGSGEHNLDEQWEAQQEILKERRAHFDKEDLKNKYQHETNEISKIKVREIVSEKRNLQHMDATWTDDDAAHAAEKAPKKQPATQKKAAAPKMPAFKFPWDKK